MKIQFSWVDTHVAKVGLPNKLQLQLFNFFNIWPSHYISLCTSTMPTDRDPDDQNTHNNRDQPSNMPRNDDWESDTNPFVAFRRFADEQVSSVLQSITGLPSSVNPPQSDNWTIFTDDNGYKSMAYRHRVGTSNAAEREPSQNQSADNSTPGDRTDYTNDESNQQITKFWQKPSNPPEDTGRSSRPRNTRRDEQRPSDFFGLDSFFRSFEDRFFPFASSFFHPHHNFFFSDMFNDGDSPTWPFTYIMLSPYSPLHLERQAQYRAAHERGVFGSIMSSLRFDSESEFHDPTEPRWREAFEDLLRLENGKPMLDRDSTTRSQASKENGSEWLHGLVKRGSLGDHWKYVSGTDGHPWTGITFTGYNEDGRDVPEPERKALEQTSAAHDEKEAESELALYERFLHDIEAREREFSREIASSPLLQALLEERQRRRDVFEKFERGLLSSDDEHGNDDTESWLDLVSGGNRKSVPETKDSVTPTPTAAVENKHAESSAENVTARVVSTMIRTERTRLPDGSIETRKVQTKRFEDGREETESSVETSHSPSDEAQQGGNDSQSKSGWFWKD